MSAPFKVGDRVTALAGGPNALKWDESDSSWPEPRNVGRTGKVLEVCDNGLRVEFGPSDTDYARFAYWAKETPATDKFTVGDVVTLKSGGPKMTVEGVTEDGVETTWHSTTGDALGALYPPEALCRK